ncbi:Protein ALP1-like [Cardamine amara subsp. amara]|uniref:Protein ALP1-like n=1 Tax=Cardamine amara subsp. amara TaxID=228776 RepID=A0ABD1BL29_CARAN
METLFKPVIDYYKKYYCRQPMGTEWGLGWCNIKTRIYNYPRDCLHLLRMRIEVFTNLCETLRTEFGMKSTRNISVEETLALFLVICGHNMAQHSVGLLFGRAQETVGRKFKECLQACTKLSGRLLRKQSAEQLRHVPRGLRDDNRYWPYFNGFIGAMDGTHCTVMVAGADATRFYNRHSQTSINVLAICNLDLLFTYIFVGCPGSVHDARVLSYAMERDPTFPTPPVLKYYLVDSGYANTRGFLAPFRGHRYHLTQFQDGSPPRDEEELFNRWHSSLRSVIERTFGVWKKKWRILSEFPRYNVETQNKLILATAGLHNFIRLSQIPDFDFDSAFQSDAISREQFSNNEESGVESSFLQEQETTADGTYMQTIREGIKQQIWDAYH